MMNQRKKNLEMSKIIQKKNQRAKMIMINQSNLVNKVNYLTWIKNQIIWIQSKKMKFQVKMTKNKKNPSMEIILIKLMKNWTKIRIKMKITKWKRKLNT